MPSLTVACVLRSGGEYRPEHVVALYRGVQKHWRIDRLGYLRVICLTDMEFRQFGVENIKLIGGWPGWWSKLELFRPDISGDLLYIDLDTVIVGDLTDVASVKRLTVLRDFYHANKPDRRGWLQSSFMYLPEACRAPIWARWLLDPQGHMAHHVTTDDQKFLQVVVGGEAVRWQDVLPDQVISYKVHVKPNRGKVPDDARVVCFHGPPRPWDCGHEWAWRQGR